MKTKLYVDFDGVILNTVDITYGELGEVDLNDYEAVEYFYEHLDWDDLLKRSKPIKNSIENLKKLIDSDLYDISVLSHVVSKGEALAKRVYLNEKIPGLELITVNREYNKCDVVPCKNAILIDDYLGNLELWYEKGGIPIKFSDKGKKYNFMTITSLLDMLDYYDEIMDLIKISNYNA